MKGFEIQVRDKQVYASIEKGVTSVILDCRNNNFGLSAGGLNTANLYHIRWLTINDLQVGNKIRIKATEFDKPSEVIKSYPSDRQQLLKEYENLKITLEERGAI